MKEDFEIISIAEDLKVLRPSSPYWPESANVYLFADGEGVSFFDVGCGNPRSVDRLFKGLKALGWDAKPIRRIVLSHAHPDHSGGLDILLSESNALEIILHEVDLPYALDPASLRSSFDIPLCEANAEGVEDRQERDKEDSAFDLLAFFRSLGCAMCRVEPTLRVVEGDTIRVGQYNFEVFHTPGHAPGHISLYESARRMLLSGDILGDVIAWYAPSSGGASGYLMSLDKMEALDIDLVLPSHGKETSDVQGLIQKARETILSRDRAVLEALKERPRRFQELNRMLFPRAELRFFPGTTILKSHLEKLEKEQRIEEDPERGVYRLRQAL